MKGTISTHVTSGTKRMADNEAETYKRKEKSPTNSNLAMPALNFFSDKIIFKGTLKSELWPKQKIVSFVLRY